MGRKIHTQTISTRECVLRQVSKTRPHPEMFCNSCSVLPSPQAKARQNMLAQTRGGSG